MMHDSETSGSSPESGVDNLPRRLEWTLNPWREHPLKTAAAFVLSTGIAVLMAWTVTYPNFDPQHVPAAGDVTGWWKDWIAWSLLSVAFVLGMTAPLYIVHRYVLDPEQVTTFFLGVPSRRPWSHYRNYYKHPNGVYLTTSHKPSRLDPFRGRFLRTCGNREQVIAYIEEHMTLKGVSESDVPRSG
jgi:hypothetical protein